MKMLARQIVQFAAASLEGGFAESLESAGDGGIDGIAACLEYLNAGVGGEIMLSGDHPVFRDGESLGFAQFWRG